MPSTLKKHNPIYQAQAILSRRDHAEGEVRQKMKRKGFTEEETQAAVDWLYEQNLLNDAQFARRYAASLVATKPVGPRWVKAKLQQRQLPAEHIEAALEHVFSEYSEHALARQAAEAWHRLHPQADKAREKLYRHLASRGFSIDAVESAVNKPYTVE